MNKHELSFNYFNYRYRTREFHLPFYAMKFNLLLPLPLLFFTFSFWFFSVVCSFLQSILFVCPLSHMFLPQCAPSWFCFSLSHDQWALSYSSPPFERLLSTRSKITLWSSYDFTIVFCFLQSKVNFSIFLFFLLYPDYEPRLSTTKKSNVCIRKRTQLISSSKAGAGDKCLVWNCRCRAVWGLYLSSGWAAVGDPTTVEAAAA